MTYSPIDKDELAKLPKPTIIDELDFETLLGRRRDVFAVVADASGLNLGDFLMLESATENVLLQEASYSEMLLRSRINEVYRVSLLYFAKGADLDHVAESHGVQRMEGESDDRLRLRTRIHNRGSSAAGPDDWWKFHAMTADSAVEDVAVSRIQFPTPGIEEDRGLLTIAILASTPDGVPTELTLNNVRDALESSSIRPTTVEVVVEAATNKAFSVTAKIWLLPKAPLSVFDSLEQDFRDIYAQNRALGFDVTTSFVTAALMRPGVQRIELLSPTSTISVLSHEAPLLEDVTLTLQGRDF